MGGGWIEIALVIFEGADPSGEGRFGEAAKGIFARKGEDPGGTQGAAFAGETFLGGIVPGGKEPGCREKG